jgi:hypothetical protein
LAKATSATPCEFLITVSVTMNLKKFLPFEKYILTTRLSYVEVIKRLADNIEPNKTFRFSGFNRNTIKPYQGEIFGNSFTISSNINYTNSFLPVITGSISMFVGHTQINIKMKPVTFVLIFISLWLGIVGLVCIGILLTGLLQFKQILNNGFSPMLLIPFGMFIFGCLLISLAFKAESKKSKEFLATLLDGQETN